MGLVVHSSSKSIESGNSQNDDHDHEDQTEFWLVYLSVNCQPSKHSQTCMILTDTMVASREADTDIVVEWSGYSFANDTEDKW